MPSHLHTVIKQNGIITTDKFKLVNHLNNHFVKVGCAFEDNPCIPTPSSINLAPTTRLPILGPPLPSFLPIKESEVLQDLLNLDTHKSAGLDTLDPIYLKTAAHIITAPILLHFQSLPPNRCIPSGLEISCCHPTLQRW